MNNPRPPGAQEFDRARIEELLGQLDQRLKARGIAASIYLVGGAAIALSIENRRTTRDLDAAVSDTAVLEEARAIAEAEGLPGNWLNQNARGWIPSRPAGALTAPASDGLTIHVAPPEHLLAMKLIAARSRDYPDILVLAERLGMGTATSQQLVDLLHSVYSGEDELEQMLGTADVDVEALAIADTVVAYRRQH